MGTDASNAAEVARYRAAMHTRRDEAADELVAAAVPWLVALGSAVPDAIRAKLDAYCAADRAWHAPLEPKP